MLYRILSVFSSMVATFGLSVAANVLMSRLLGPTQRGAHAVATLLAMTLMIVVDFGMRSALLYNVSRNQNRVAALQEGLAVCTNLILWSAAIAGLAYGLLFLVGADSFLQGVSVRLLGASYVYCIATLILDVFSTLFVSVRDFRARNLTMFVFAAVYAAVIIIWFLARWPLTAIQTVTIQIAAAIVAAVAAWVHLTRHYHPIWTLQMPNDWKHRYIGYGLKSLAAQLAVQGSARLDTFIVNALLGNHAVGIYSAGVSVAELPQHVTNAASVVMYPEIGQRKGADRLRMTLTTIGSSLYLVVLICVVLAIALPWLLPAIYGQAFAAGVPAGLYLLPGMFGMTLFRMLGAVTSAHGRPEFRTYAAIGGLGATVILDFALIPRWGIIGAAWASSIAYTILAVLMVGMYIRLGETDLRSAVRGLMLEPIFALRRQVAIFLRPRLCITNTPGSTR